MASAFSPAKVTIDLDEYNHLKSIESKTEQSVDTGSIVLAIVLNSMRHGPIRPEQILNDLKTHGLVVAINRDKMNSLQTIHPQDIIIAPQP